MLDNRNNSAFFEKKFTLRYFETDETAVASPETILTLLEETAAEHCNTIGYDLYRLVSEGIGWVLIGGYLKMYRYPKYNEVIIIKTWLSKYTSVKGFRENIIYDSLGNIIGRARGLWIFFDIENRRPKRIYEAIKNAWSFDNSLCLDYDISKKINPITISDYNKEFRVNRYDTDMNKHVNNIRYLQWVMESIPEDIIASYYLESVDGRFITEAYYSDVILSLTLAQEDSASKMFSHTIRVKGNNQVCATAHTVWKRK